MTSISTLYRRTGFHLRAACIVAIVALMVGLGAAQAASATVRVGSISMGVSGMNCEADNSPALRVINVTSNSSQLTYARTWIEQSGTGKQIAETSWHTFNSRGIIEYVNDGFGSFWSPNYYGYNAGFNWVGHHYYNVWEQYAVQTSAGWQYPSERITRFLQEPVNTATFGANPYLWYQSSSCIV